jgi:hypothetical protein
VGRKGATANDFGTGARLRGSDVHPHRRREHFPVVPNAMVISFCASGVDYSGPTKVLPSRRWGPLLSTLQVDAIEKKPLPAGVYTALKASNAGNVTANILGSGADVIIRVIDTEGATDSSNLTRARAPRSN